MVSETDVQVFHLTFFVLFYLLIVFFIIKNPNATGISSNAYSNVF